MAWRYERSWGVSPWNGGIIPHDQSGAGQIGDNPATERGKGLDPTARARRNRAWAAEDRVMEVVA